MPDTCGELVNVFNMENFSKKKSFKKPYNMQNTREASENNKPITLNAYSVLKVSFVMRERKIPQNGIKIAKCINAIPPIKT